MTRDEAWTLLTQYNQGAFHLRHAVTVEGVMRYFAQELLASETRRTSGAPWDCSTTWILNSSPRSTATRKPGF